MTTKTIDITTTEVTLNDLLDQLTPDTEIVITRGDTPVARLAPTVEPPEPKPRVLGLHQGQGWMADDFDDELPMSFWLGEDDL